MQKEFNHNSFKKAVSNVSGFLKEKEIDIPYITLLNALSLFLGAKNWNTLKTELDNKDKAVILEEKTNPSSLYFEERLKAFLELTLDKDILFGDGHWLNFNDWFDKKNRFLSCVEKILKEDKNLNEFDLTEIDDLLVVERYFDNNHSLSDEETYMIQIAQKGNGVLNSNYLDIVFLLYAIDNKWFEKYVMGEVKYSYIYNKKINKEVLKISLPIDNFCTSEFMKEWENMKLFLKLFYNNIKAGCENASNESGYYSQKILNQVASAGYNSSMKVSSVVQRSVHNK